MLDRKNRDDKVYLVASSADATTPVTMVLYDSKTSTARELDTDERLILDRRQIVNGHTADLTLEIFLDLADNATPTEANRIDRVPAAAGGGGIAGQVDEREVPAGVVVKGKASGVGQVYFRAAGYVARELPQPPYEQ